VSYRATIQQASEAVEHISTLLEQSLRSMRPLAPESPTKKQAPRLEPSLDLMAKLASLEKLGLETSEAAITLQKEIYDQKQEVAKASMQTTTLTKKVLFLQEKIKLYQESIIGGGEGNQNAAKETTKGFAIKLVPTNSGHEETSGHGGVLESNNKLRLDDKENLP
jgi:hypothetical protein